MSMIKIDNELIQGLFEKAQESERKRMNYDLRTHSTSSGQAFPIDNSQRMLNALLPGTVVPVHRHPMSNENVLLLTGKLVEVIYEDPLQSPLKGDDSSHLVEKERFMLDPSVGNFGCVVPAGAWHTVEVLEPSVIFEAKDGKYGEDGSESFVEFQKVSEVSGGSESSESSTAIASGESGAESSFSNCLGDLKKNIGYLIGMERQSGSMDAITPLYVSRMLNVPLEDVEKCMKEMGL